MRHRLSITYITLEMKVEPLSATLARKISFRYDSFVLRAFAAANYFLAPKTGPWNQRSPSDKGRSDPEETLSVFSTNKGQGVDVDDFPAVILPAADLIQCKSAIESSGVISLPAPRRPRSEMKRRWQPSSRLDLMVQALWNPCWTDDFKLHCRPYVRPDAHYRSIICSTRGEKRAIVLEDEARQDWDPNQYPSGPATSMPNPFVIAVMNERLRCSARISDACGEEDQGWLFLYKTDRCAGARAERIRWHVDEETETKS
ncbi:uncharacterized protein ARMOST_02441 [Armillaria ostoyae]|uniref:Uncharacterized protein n=1 Tax=Armillaria ostoyae TaxID=47428 RepID=A0A284QRP1_ARMOS|nr:uncharacterized protein ARMOST_02441 [Armillaria ostoyae]